MGLNVLGDNSTDSRLLDQFDTVPFENLIGRAAIIYHSKLQTRGAEPTIRFDRIGIIVR